MKLKGLPIPVCVAAGVLLANAFPRGQGISGVDARESARFVAIASATARAGYATPVVVGHGAGAMDALFALLATRDGKGVLLAVVEPGQGSARPVELERDETPAAFGIRGIEFGAFLDAPDLYDIVVSHAPFMLESSRRFDTHHVLRHRGTALEAVCEFPGGSSSSSSKGMGSISGTSRVTIKRSPGSPPGFVLTTIDETIEQIGKQPPATTSHAETSAVFDLPSSGICTPRPARP